MKIAIVGGGISGLVSAYHLHRNHEVTVFEANDYIGGHTNTVDFELDGRSYSIDTGFIVFNDHTYPNFINLLNELGVESQPTIMSFSVTCEKTGLEYRGADFNGLFAQRKNLLNPAHYWLLLNIVKFNRRARRLLAEGDPSLETVGDFIQRERLSAKFVEQFLLPMGSAVWSCPFDKFLKFPMQFIAEFYENHGLLNVTKRPQWRVIRGGSQQYVKKLIAPFKTCIRTETPVTGVKRNEQEVEIRTTNDATEKFDFVIFACHADQALKILADQATEAETDVLSAFPYEKNIATLHTQASLLPKCRRAWAAWNYFNPQDGNRKSTVTYNMNILQSVESDQVFNVTLNDDGRIERKNVIKEFVYHHPTFDARQKSMQDRHAELIGPNRTAYCGAYWGNGFHEDGVNSALAIIDHLERKP